MLVETIIISLADQKNLNFKSNPLKENIIFHSFYKAHLPSHPHLWLRTRILWLGKPQLHPSPAILPRECSSVPLHLSFAICKMRVGIVPAQIRRSAQCLAVPATPSKG